MSFLNIPNIEDEYRSLADDVINAFYIPCLKEAKIYKRATAYFSSAVLLQITKGLYKFIENGGKMYLLVSTDLSKDDYEAIKKGYDIRKAAENNLVESFKEDIEFEQKEGRFTLLSYLIEKGILEVKVAIPTSESANAIYHEKLGIMNDNLNNTIAFSGSANETSQAYNLNYETIDVYCSWKSDDANGRCYKKEKRFERMWENQEDNLVVMDFPTVIKNKILKYNKYENVDFAKLDVDLEELIRRKSIVEKTPQIIPSGLYEYQNEAIDSWMKNNNQSCLTLATGTGKTYIGCGAITRLFEKTNRLFVVICCPYTHLVDQWAEDVKAFNIKPLTYYSDTRNYDEIKRKLLKFKTKRTNFACLIVTNGSFVTPRIQELLHINEKETLIIADEAHNFGARKISEYMNEEIPYRLALSATLERYGDPEGTEKILNYFGPITYDYPLARAIEEDKLTKYYYYPLPVYLNPDEYERYQVLSERINSFHVGEGEEMPDVLKQLLIKRARIIAETKDKLSVLKNKLLDYKDKNNILIYCGAVKYEEDGAEEDDIRQIECVRNMVKEDGLKMVASKFTSEETIEERRELIRAFKNNEIQALIAIKCLDEGVNIPAIKTAFVLASSTNPKEYIQRRGRVLRKYPGKEYAEIYDFITLPRKLNNITAIPDNVRGMERSLVKREFTRMKDFANLSKNPSDSNKLMDEIRNVYDLDTIEEDEII